MKCLNDECAGCRAIQTEGFVADNTNIGQLQGEIIGNGWNDAVATYQNSYLTRRNALVHEHTDGTFQFYQYLLLIIVARQQTDVDQTL